MGFTSSYRWSANVTLKSPKDGSKSDFFWFLNKSQLLLNKVCYKVSLCENTQQQSSSTTIPVSNGPWILAQTVNLQPKI